MVQGLKKPSWLNKRIDLAACGQFYASLEGLNLHTVCREALCPNISECAGAGVATFLILGAICTRSCSFCAIKKGRPHGLDPDMPRRVAEAVKRLGLSHAVVTSVTRDDLPDGGAAMFAQTIRAIRKIGPDITVEVLVPDFGGSREAVKIVADADPRVFAHNIETVPRLYPVVRRGADYRRSLSVLKTAKDTAPSLRVKSGIMVGLGETYDEVLEAMADLRKAACDILTIGQYLSPGPGHLSVKEYIPPETFELYKNGALRMGFSHAQCAPYVRSSYMASGHV